MLGQLSIRFKLLAVTTLLSLLVIGLAGYFGVYQDYKQNQTAQYLTRANEMSDHLLYAASRQALERGITNTLLSRFYTSGQSDQNLFNNIQTQRGLAREAFEKGLAIADELANHPIATEQYMGARAALIEAKQLAEQYRARFDGLIAGSGERIEQREWLGVMTSLITRGADLRVIAFSLRNSGGRVSELNQNFKQAIWLASEHAGLERAIMGQAIASQKPVPAANQERLSRLRAIVDLELGNIIKFSETYGIDLDAADAPYVNAIQAAVETMRQTFLLEFEETRTSVYAVKDSGSYPIEAGEWLQRSTAGIESILAINDEVSAYAAFLAEGVGSRAVTLLWISVVLTLLAILLALVGVLVVLQVSRRINNFEQVFGQASADKDLTLRLQSERDELGRMADAYNRFSQGIEGVLTQTMESIVEVTDSATTMGEVAEATQAGIAMQQTATDEVTSEVDGMAKRINEVAEQSEKASHAANDANAAANRGSEVTQQTISAIKILAENIDQSTREINELQSQNQEIGGIVSVIRSIAEQTNLLALNAAIEAARAGEAGRGFAVVADEVRNLASRTQESTAEIESIIERLTSSTQNVVAVMERSKQHMEESVTLSDETGNALELINTTVNEITEINQKIADLTREQASVSSMISQNLRMNIHQFSDLSNRSATQTGNAGVDLVNSVSDLREALSQYTIGNSSILLLQTAKNAHLSWKNKIEDFLDGKLTLTAEQAVSHEACDLGRWYYSEEARPYYEYDEMKAIEAPHKALHATIRQVIDAKNAGDMQRASELKASIDIQSRIVVKMIEALEVRFGLKRRTPKRLIDQEAVSDEAVDDLLF